ncbi:hypothetical protein LP415_08535 [Polaromonas sp. P1(28)-8]|nr:hypothetical protein LP415_08535 [Polaromonas sp. P1(28)-8]
MLCIVFFSDFHDKHAAHSVNEFEENIVRAQYCVERVQDEGITAIGYGGGRVASLGGREIQAVIEITKILEMHLENQMKEEQKRLLALVRKMPLEQVLAGGQKVFQPSLRNVSAEKKIVAAF